MNGITGNGKPRINIAMPGSILLYSFRIALGKRFVGRTGRPADDHEKHINDEESNG